jgi:hypothetical protein
MHMDEWRNTCRYSVHVAEELAADVLAASLLVVEDARGGGL